MGPPKARKARTNTRAKPRGGRGGGENGKMNDQLTPLGLKVVNITGDGNCFFRAIADQLQGNEEEHAKYRRMVVDYLEEHKPDFEPFLDDEMPFDEYCNNMRQDGTWAGHMELQAMSLATRCNICIHRIMFPRWQILNFQKPGTPVLHLTLNSGSRGLRDYLALNESLMVSYHGEEHYNSVRPVDDDGSGPPNLERVKAATKLVNEAPPPKDGKNQGAKATKADGRSSASAKLVMEGSGCTDAAYVKQILDEVHGDTSAAVEFLISQKNFSEDIIQSVEDVSVTLSNREIEGSITDETSPLYEPDLETINLLIKKVEGISDDEAKTIPSGSKKSESGSRSKPVVSRNKACPCGSKKKYKTCCGALPHKPSVTILTGGPEGNLSNKARKDRSRSARAALGASSSQTKEAKEVDLGVLCI